MALRAFRAGGVLWRVWSVIPGTRVDDERRHGYDRRSPEPVIRYTGPERRQQADRRQRALAVSAAMAAGWLVFEAPAERRRLAPIPPGWEWCPDTELARLCARAMPVPIAPILPR